MKSVPPLAPPGLTPVLAEFRQRMGADCVWFAEIVLVPGTVVLAKEQARPQRPWWCRIWTDGHPAASVTIRQFEDQPIDAAAHVDLQAPPLTWQITQLQGNPEGFWAQSFARQVYIRHDLHEEHRLLIFSGEQCLGLLVAAWDRRRTGVAKRMSRVMRQKCAHWVSVQLAAAHQQAQHAEPQPEGELVLTAEAEVAYASDPALLWLTNERLARLEAVVRREIRPDGLLNGELEPLSLAAAGAGIQLTPLRGRAGMGWLARLRVPARPPLEVRSLLTPSQREVVDLVNTGCTAAEIARHLGKSVETVRTQIKQAYGRLGVANRLELSRVLPQAFVP